MKIRLATITDAGILATLIQDVQRLHADAMPDLFKQPDDLAPYVRDFQENVLNDPESRVYIAEEHEPAGYVYAQIRRRPENAFTYAINVVYIDQISVRPAYRRMGCGRALIEAVFDLARAEGIERVALDSWNFNAEAHEFFYRMGFKVFNLRMDARVVGQEARQ